MAKSRTPRLKNTLVQYKGGGADGEFWSWNFCFFDRGGNFHDISASGRDGCPTEDLLQQNLESSRKGSDYFLYDLTESGDVTEFVRETNDGLVVQVARWLQEHFPEEAEKIRVKCGVCNEDFPAYLAEHEGYRGNGGIGVSYEGFVCLDCQDKESIPADSIQPMIVIVQKGGVGA